MMRLARPLAASVLLSLAMSGPAQAQGVAYTPQPPTKGALYRDGQDGRYLLGGTWLYRPDTSDVGLAQGWWKDIAATDGWSPVAVPNAYNAGNFTSASMNGYVGWYRRDFTLPGGAFARYVPRSARRWIVRFESVNYRATVWINGRLIGIHTGAYLPFELDLKGLRSGVNRLIVRVDNRRSPSDLPPAPGGPPPAPGVPSPQWWNYGGILREVYLRVVQGADISRVTVRPLLPCRSCAATIEEQAVVRNPTGTPQTVQLRGSYGGTSLFLGSARIAPHGSWTAQGLAKVIRPRLWWPDRPSLYRATLTLSDARGRRLGGYTTYSGIREVTVTPGGRLTLNGRLLRLRGVNLHEQDLTQGAAVDPAQLQQLIAWIRSVGAMVIRAHYPLNPQLEEMADRDGLLLWSEVPVFQVREPYLSQPGWLPRARAMLAQNIRTNQNHPSVLLWSIGNELPTPADGAEARYISRATSLAHQLDPTRPVGMAISDWPGVPCQGAYRPLDVLGFNDYFGWFDAGGGATDDRDALSPFLDSFRACYPRKALFVSEFGADGNRHGPVEERGTYEFQANSAAYHLSVFDSKPWLSGAIWFVLEDFAAYPGYSGGNPRPNSPFNGKGLVDLFGDFKPAFSVVSGMYHNIRQLVGH
jgi:beta-glucuronidase